jgi:hypothetical protein
MVLISFFSKKNYEFLIQKFMFDIENENEEIIFLEIFMKL